MKELISSYRKDVSIDSFTNAYLLNSQNRKAMYHSEAGQDSDEDVEFGTKPTGFLPSFTLTSCVTLSKPLNFSVLPFPYLLNKDNTNATARCSQYEQCLACSKCLLSVQA